MLKVVLDTNIFASATISQKGNPAKILALWRQQKFELIVTEKIMQEAWRVLFYPRVREISVLSTQEVTNLLLRLHNSATFIPTTLDLNVIEKDPTDDKYIIAALEGQADYIVSGDKHLLELASYQNIRIVSPGEFVEILEEYD